MALKTKTSKELLDDLRSKNKDNPNYPRLKKINDKIEVKINNETFVGTKEEVIEKYKDIPYFMEELNDLEKNDFIDLNLSKLDEMLNQRFGR